MGPNSKERSGEIIGRIIKKVIPRFRFRWEGKVYIKGEDGIIYVYRILGSIIQWFSLKEKVILKGNEIYREYNGDLVRVWPPFRKEYELERKNPLTNETLYKYRLLIREAIFEKDFLSIVELEQYHYASKKELVAIWYDPQTKKLIESNVKPSDNAVLIEIKGSLPVSRFLILELLDRQPFEPEIIGYVRVDPPIPLVHRKINGKVEKNARLKIFPKDWIYPTYWPEKISRKLIQYYKTLRTTKSKKLSRKLLFEKIKEKSIRLCNTSGARISRVVIHPDYRGYGLGMLAVKGALEWVKTYRIPEMKKEKHYVETIAQMARFNPFFEKVGFKYLFDTKSGRPYLVYPLTKKAEELINKFLFEDPIAKKHKGKLFKEYYAPEKPLESSIILTNVTKIYKTTLDISTLPKDIQNVLKAFGVEKRSIERYILKNVNLEIKPGEVIVVCGISGAGKTTLLRLILSKVFNRSFDADEGEIKIPKNVKVSALIPGEFEPKFEEESLIEHVYKKLGNIYEAIEVLNYSGLSDAVFYRAKFSELSTGQKERAKIASMLADKPNLVLIDEFCAHLDPLTAQRVTRKLVNILRKFKITAILVTHRPELIRVISPDKILFVGYGGIVEGKYKKDSVG